MKLVAISLLSLLALACKSKEANKEAPPAGSAAPEAAKPTEGGSAPAAAPGSAADPAAAQGSAAAPAAPAADCGPNTFASENPPFCIDLPEKYKAEMVTEVDSTGSRYFRVGKGAPNFLEVKLEKGSSELKKEIEFAKDMAKMFEKKSKTKVKEEDIPDGKIFTYQTCQAEHGCFPALRVVKKTAAGIFHCEANSEPGDAEFIALCKTVRAK